MSKKFLPLAGIAIALAVVSYLLLSLVFPHKKEAPPDTSVKAEDVFSAQVNEAEAQPTATTAEQAEITTPAASETAGTEVPAEAPAEEPLAEVVAETPTEAPVETPVETAGEAPVAEEPAPAEAPVAEAAAVETPAPAETSSAGSGLTRDQLAKIVAEAAAQAAAETAKSIAEQAAREAAAR